MEALARLLHIYSADFGMDTIRQEHEDPARLGVDPHTRPGESGVPKSLRTQRRSGGTVGRRCQYPADRPRAVTTDGQVLSEQSKRLVAHELTSGQELIRQTEHL